MAKNQAVLTKKQWLILFNVFAIVALASSGRLTASRQSFAAILLAILVVNGVAILTAGNFPEWK